jgi:hypothetical protein
MHLRYSNHPLLCRAMTRMGPLWYDVLLRVYTAAAVLACDQPSSMLAIDARRADDLLTSP